MIMVNEVRKTENNIGGLFYELTGVNIPSLKYFAAYIAVFAVMFLIFWDSFFFSTIYAVVFGVLSIWAYTFGHKGLRILAVVILLYGFSVWLFDWIPFLAAMAAVCLVRSLLHALSESDGPTNQGGCHEA